MTDIKIEKDVPIPPDWRQARAKYPWSELEVGDSIFIPGKTAGSLGGITAKARKKLGFKFTARTVDGGVRVWRIA